MSSCRFMYENFISGPEGLSVSSAQPGLVGSPAPQALGSAVCYADGEHTGSQDQVFTLEIDSIDTGSEVGQASFRWKRASADGWEASGLSTTSNLLTLTDGVRIKWVSGTGQDFYKGDAWHILAVGSQGAAALMDRDRDTAWRATGCAAEHLTADLDEAQEVKALVLADHNLSDGATAILKASGIAQEPVWEFDPSGGALENSDDTVGTNSRATPRSYIDGGVLKYAAAGESCFEDGLLSISPAVANICQNTETFGGAYWTNIYHVSVSANAVASPDGTTTADKLVESAEAAQDHYFRTDNLTLPDDTDYVAFLFLKAEERNWFRLLTQGKPGAQVSTYFDLTNGVIGTTGHSSKGIVDVGDGWYLCWVGFNSGTGGSSPRVYYNLADADNSYVYDGDGSSGLYLWGAQLTAGPVPLAYAPNDASNANDMGGSSDADAISFTMPTEMAALLASGGEGTLAAEWTPGYNGGDFPESSYPALSTDNTTKYLGPFYPSQRASNLFHFRTHDGNNGSYVEMADSAMTAGTTYTVASRWGVGSQMQIGHGATWGSAASYDGDFSGDAIYLGKEPSAPFHLGRVKFFGSWLDAEPRAVMDPWDYPGYSQALGLTSPHLVYFLDQSYRYWRLELNDAANADGLIKASLFYLGGHFQPQRTFAASYGRATVAGRKMTASDAGKLAGSAQGLAQGLSLSFPRMSTSDAEQFQAMTEAIHQQSGGQINPIFFTAFTDTPADTLYCLPDADLNRQQGPGGRWDLSLNLKEVVKTDV
jgi:hypothetical protein